MATTRTSLITRINDKKLSELMQPEPVTEEDTLGEHHNVPSANFTIMGIVVRSVGTESKGHYKHECPKGKNPRALVTVEDEEARAKVYYFGERSGISETEH
ncbi:hypothetical protein Tco_0875229 [Tanacetum coccineum]|uniref:Uncharacterized protein n=1 Tax=Tanacetum coccineum TaxID=301880 RepID=A0ABQ5BPN0_9ASTR